VIATAAGMLARPRNWPYLDRMARRRRCAVPSIPFIRWSSMALPVSTPQQLPGISQPARGVASAIVMVAAGLGAVLLMGALALWFHYGTAVFFEMIASGISACF
jgi:hypothetical protein